jgi:N-methylhydantoinase B
LAGGKPGDPSDSLLRLPGEQEFQSVNAVRQAVPAESEGIVITAGGGGWGDPLERDPAMVSRDALEEFISAPAAREEYGVVFDPDSFNVNLEETRKLREQMRAAR